MEKELRDMITNLKVVESSNSYEDLFEKLPNNDKLYIYFKKEQENNVKFECACTYKCEELEKEILSYLKEVL